MTKRNGCYNRPPLRGSYIAQVGWGETLRDGTGAPFRVPVFADIPDQKMKKECQYSRHYGNDPQCLGCVWNQYPQAHDG